MFTPVPNSNDDGGPQPPPSPPAKMQVQRLTMCLKCSFCKHKESISTMDQALVRLPACKYHNVTMVPMSYPCANCKRMILLCTGCWSEGLDRFCFKTQRSLLKHYRDIHCSRRPHDTRFSAADVLPSPSSSPSIQMSSCLETERQEDINMMDVSGRDEVVVDDMDKSK